MRACVRACVCVQMLRVRLFMLYVYVGCEVIITFYQGF